MRNNVTALQLQMKYSSYTDVIETESVVRSSTAHQNTQTGNLAVHPESSNGHIQNMRKTNKNTQTTEKHTKASDVVSNSETQNENTATATTDTNADAAETPFTKEDAKALRQHEETIDRNLKSFRDTGRALKAISDQKLHREKYSSFEEYCPDRWDMSASHAHRLIEAAEFMDVIEEASPIGEPNPVMPQNEAQVRAVLEIQKDREKWAETWAKVVAKAKGERITAEKITSILAAKGSSGKKQKAAQTKAEGDPRLKEIKKLVTDVLKKADAKANELKQALEKIKELLAKKKGA
jgi:hypothetical protein